MTAAATSLVLDQGEPETIRNHPQKAVAAIGVDRLTVQAPGFDLELPEGAAK